MALCEFQHGYIYQKYAKYLGDAKLCESINHDDFTDAALGCIDTCYTEALIRYDYAFEYFKKLSHWKGMSICKKLAA